LMLILAVVLGIEIFLVAIGVYCLVKVSNINKKSEVFFKGKNGEDLEVLILKNTADIKTMDSEIQELYNISNTIHGLAQKSVHKVGIIRFNPFNDIGGDQSFCVALLNGQNTGVVISSLHTKEGTRVYAKPVKKGAEDKYPFTEEEKKAVKSAILKKGNKV
jgi:hypothetical protein